MSLVDQPAIQQFAGMSSIYDLINGKTTEVDATKTNTSTSSTAPVTNTSTATKSGSTDTNTTANSGSTNTSLSDVLSQITGSTSNTGTNASTSDTLNSIISSSLQTNTGTTSNATSGSMSQNTSGFQNQSQTGSSTSANTGTTVQSGSQNVTTNVTAGSDNTTSTTVANHLDQAGLDAMLNTILSGTSGLASVSKGQHEAGLYNSSTNTQLTNDLLTRVAGEIAKANSSVTTDSTQHIGATTGTSTQNIGGSTSTSSNSGTATNVANIAGTSGSSTSGTNSSTSTGTTSGTSATTGSQTNTGSTNTTGTTANIGTTAQTNQSNTTGSTTIGPSTSTSTLVTGPSTVGTTTNLGGTTTTASGTENLDSTTTGGGLTADGIAKTALAGLTGSALTSGINALKSAFPNLFPADFKWDAYTPGSDYGDGGTTGDPYNPDGGYDTTVGGDGIDLSAGTDLSSGVDFGDLDSGALDLSSDFGELFARGGLVTAPGKQVMKANGYADGGLVEDDYTKLMTNRKNVDSEMVTDITGSPSSAANFSSGNIAQLAVKLAGAYDNPVKTPELVVAAKTLDANSPAVVSSNTGNAQATTGTKSKPSNIGTDVLEKLLASGSDTSVNGYRATYSNPASLETGGSPEFVEIIGNVTSTGGKFGVGAFDSYDKEGKYLGHRSQTPDQSGADFLSFLGGSLAIGLGGAAGFAKNLIGREVKDAIATYSTGGPVSGPGTTTSDSIPIKVSDKEFVTNAHSTQALGVDVMEEINNLRVGDPRIPKVRSLLGLGV